jgi:hypothetical protein
MTDRADLVDSARGTDRPRRRRKTADVDFAPQESLDRHDGRIIAQERGRGIAVNREFPC